MEFLPFYGLSMRVLSMKNISIKLFINHSRGSLNQVFSITKFVHSTVCQFQGFPSQGFFFIQGVFNSRVYQFQKLPILGVFHSSGFPSQGLVFQGLPILWFTVQSFPILGFFPFQGLPMLGFIYFLNKGLLINKKFGIF